MNYRYISLFSGIEACTVAWETLGWTPVAFAQYEPGDRIQFPSQVLKHHYPDVPNLGDVTKITEEQIAALGHIDLLVGGSPCQDLSVAGKRAGLRKEDGTITRSGLFDYQLQIFEWARRNNGCRWLLWENVPGALSSGKEVPGADFGYILGSMVERDVPVPGDGWKNSGVVISDDWSRIVEWRVLDAQYFGVAQRRRRIFALLDVGAWWSRQPVLFEPECLSRNPPKGGGKRQGAADGAQEGPGEDRRGATLCFAEHSITSPENGNVPKWDAPCHTLSCDSRNDVVVNEGTDGPLCARDYKGVGNEYVQENKLVLCNPPTASGKDVYPTLTSNNSNKMWLGNQEAFSGDYWIREEDHKAIGWCERNMVLDTPHENRVPPLTATDYKGPPVVCYEAPKVYEIDQQGGKGGVSYTEDVMPTILSESHGTPHAVCYGFAHSQMSMNVVEDAMPPLMQRDWKDPDLVAYEEPEYEEI